MEALQYEGVVLPEWIDNNGHLNLAYYVVLFDQATDLLFDMLGLGMAYRDATGNATFAAEMHIMYEREVRVGERVAAQELMSLHIDMSIRRVAPFPDDVHQRIQEAVRADLVRPRPDGVGRRIAMPG
jgi:acyl-CoA thioester hydrolase